MSYIIISYNKYTPIKLYKPIHHIITQVYKILIENSFWDFIFAAGVTFKTIKPGQ